MNSVRWATSEHEDHLDRRATAKVVMCVKWHKHREHVRSDPPA